MPMRVNTYRARMQYEILYMYEILPSPMSINMVAATPSSPRQTSGIDLANLPLKISYNIHYPLSKPVPQFFLPKRSFFNTMLSHQIWPCLSHLTACKVMGEVRERVR